MSNYPPGVSGNEPEISGWPEAEMELSCTNGAARWLSRRLVIEMLEREPSRLADPVEDWEALEAECDFEGPVDAQIVEGVACWDCPKCGSENETDLDEWGPEL